MCLGADSHLRADRSHYLCCNDDIERLPSSGWRQLCAPSTEVTLFLYVAQVNPCKRSLHLLQF